MHEREHDHAHARHEAATHTTDLAPGHSNRAAQLVAPTNPITSGLIQRKARDANGVAEGAEQAVASASSSSGHSLPEPIMRKFESSLGADLSSVRVHTGAESQAAAAAVGAKAYTVGQDIHFGAGHYDPSNGTGQHLLAHEVAHTVQQREATPTRQYKLDVSSPADSFEREADRAADAMVSGTPFSVGGAPVVAARKEGGLEATAAPHVDKVGGTFEVGWKTPPVKVPKLYSTIVGSVTAKGDLTLDPASESDKAPKPNPAHVKQAGGFFSKKVFESEHKPDAAIEEIEIGAETETEKTPVKGKAGIGLAFGVTVKCRGGLTFKGTANILKVGKTKDEPIEVSGLTIACEENIPLYTIPKDTLWNGFKVNGGINLVFKFEIKPDKAALALEALKKFGPKLFGELGGEVATTATEVLASLPALVAVAGLYITVKATIASLKEIDDIANVAAASEKAVQGYAGGFSSAVGGKNIAGDAAWHAQGTTDGTRMLNEQIAKIQADPRFQKYQFTTEELRAALTQRVQQSPDEIYNSVYTSSKARIKEVYVKLWQDHLTTFDKWFTDTEFDERLLRTRMGLKGKGGGEAAEMPEGADTGLPPPDAD